MKPIQCKFLFLLSGFLALACNDTVNGNLPRKNDDDKKINPYAGTGKETPPSNISGAWLTQCQIESLGKAVSANGKDILYCRSTNKSNEKVKGGGITFLDSKKSAVTANALPVSDDSYFTEKYEIDPEIAKTYSADKSNFENVDYRIFDIHSFKWPGSAIVNDASFLPFIQIFNSVNPLVQFDNMFCNADGTLRSTMAIAGISLPPSTPGLKTTNDPITIAPATISGDACYGSISQFRGGSNPFKGFGQPSLFSSDASNKIIATGTTGCAVALIYQVEKATKTFANPKFVILDKAQVKEEMKSQSDITLNRLKSAAYASQCETDPFGFISRLFP
jgi:hypothetical protein